MVDEIRTRTIMTHPIIAKIFGRGPRLLENNSVLKKTRVKAMVDEIGNFFCSQCDEPIAHEALGDATVQLTRIKGIVFICAE